MKKEKETTQTETSTLDPLLVLLEKPHKTTSITEEEIEKLKSSLGNALKLINQLEAKLQMVNEDMKNRTDYLLKRLDLGTIRDSQDSWRMAEYVSSPYRICPICGDPKCPHGHKY